MPVSPQWRSTFTGGVTATDDLFRVQWTLDFFAALVRNPTLDNHVP
jgi:hypothetical protein